MLGTLKVIEGKSFKQIDVDSSGNSQLICGITPDNEIFCSSNLTTPVWTKKNGTIQQISLNGSKAVGINSSNKIVYNSMFNTENIPAWVELSGNRTYTQVDYNGQVACAIGKDDKFVYCTDNLDVSNNVPTWVKLFGGYEQVAVSDGKLYAVNSNNTLYWSTSYKTTTTPWTLIPGNVKKISFSENKIAGIDLSDNVVFGTANTQTPNWIVINATINPTRFSNVSFNKDKIFAVSTDNKLYQNVLTDNSNNQAQICKGSQLETQACILYCNMTTVNCDAVLKEYCNTNPDSRLCGCFRSDDYYLNVKSSITNAFEGKFENTNNYCYFKDCRDSIIKPFNFKNNTKLCDDDSSCFKYKTVDTSGNLKEIETTSDKGVCSNIKKKDSGGLSAAAKTAIALGVTVVIILIIWAAFRKRS